MSRIIKIVQVFIGVIIGLCGLFLCAASIGVGVSVILFALMFIPAVRRQVRKIPFIGNKKGLLYVTWIILSCLLFIGGVISFDGDTVDTTTVTEKQPSISEENEKMEEAKDENNKNEDVEETEPKINGDGADTKEDAKEEFIEDQNVEINKEYKDDSYWYAEMKHICDYVESEGVDYPNFRERENLANLLTESNYDKKWANMTYVNDYTKISGATEYTMTLEESGDLLYWGEVNKDGKPDGIGILYECYYYVNYDYQNPDLVIRYMGEFKDGFYSGYGVEFEVPDWDADYYYLDLTEESLQIINQPVYEGYFKEGLRHGKGVEILSTLGAIDYTNNTVSLDPATADYSMYIGNYTKGDLKGDVKIYYCGTLVYEGEFKNGNVNGKGKQYFVEPEGVLKYEGEFSGGEYQGEGTLYDENGDVIFKGEFSAGDIAQ